LLDGKLGITNATYALVYQYTVRNLT